MLGNSSGNVQFNSIISNCVFYGNVNNLNNSIYTSSNNVKNNIIHNVKNNSSGRDEIQALSTTEVEDRDHNIAKDREDGLSDLGL